MKLLGHRYYDSRTGRFISQDPSGDGDNWYAYAGNDPVNETDAEGLSIIYDPSKEGMQWQSGWTSAGRDYWNGVDGTYDFFKGNGHGGLVYSGTDVVGRGYLNYIDSLPMPGGAGSPGAGMGPGGRGGSTMFAQTMSESTNPPGQVLIHQMAEEGVGVGKPGNPLELAKEDLSAIRSHVDLIEEHVAKLRHYKRDPLSMDNKGTLTNPNNAQHLEQIIQGRIHVLEKTIQKHFGEIIRILNKG